MLQQKKTNNSASYIKIITEIRKSAWHCFIESFNNIFRRSHFI